MAAIDRLQGLGSPAQAGGVGAVENDKGSLEGNITEDVDANVRAVLQTAEASGAARGDGGVVDVAAGDGNSGAADTEHEVWESCAALEHPAAVGGAVGSAADGGVVGLNNSSAKVQQGGAGISNTDNAGGLESSGTNSVAGRGELPVAGVGVDVDIGQGASVLGAVNDTKVVATS